MFKKILLFYNIGIEVQELYEMFNDSGLMKEFKEGMVINFEKVVYILNVYFVLSLVNRMSDMYLGVWFNRREIVSLVQLGLGSKYKSVIM